MKKLLVILLAGILTTTLSAQQSVKYRSAGEQLNEDYCTGLFKTTEGTIIDVTSQISANAYINILDWLQGRVSGLQVYTSRTGVTIPVMRGRIPGIFIDEFQVSASTLTTLPIQDIAMVKIIKTPFFGGFHSDGGAIAIYTVGTEEEEE